MILTSGHPIARIRELPPGVAYLPKPWQPLNILVVAEQALASAQHADRLQCNQRADRPNSLSTCRPASRRRGRFGHAFSFVRAAPGRSARPSPNFCSPVVGPLNLSSAASATRFIPKPCAGR